jgi:CheY-like chemotaxis protein
MQFKTCFLIDDDEDDQEIFTLALREADASIRCVTANDGVEALTRLTGDKTFIPDYIFLDLNMPLMNGKECLREIRKHTHLRDVPVIIFSTSSEPHEIEETRRLGANEFITKPPLISSLSRQLAEFFKTFR